MPKKTFNLNDLLNTASKQPNENVINDADTRIQPLSISYLDVKDLVPSKKNFYDTSDVAALKASILAIGVRQNLTVRQLAKPFDGRYEVKAGHRR